MDGPTLMSAGGYASCGYGAPMAAGYDGPLPGVSSYMSGGSGGASTLPMPSYSMSSSLSPFGAGLGGGSASAAGGIASYEAMMENADLDSKACGGPYSWEAYGAADMNGPSSYMTEEPLANAQAFGGGGVGVARMSSDARSGGAGSQAQGRIVSERILTAAEAQEYFGRHSTAPAYESGGRPREAPREVAVRDYSPQPDFGRYEYLRGDAREAREHYQATVAETISEPAAFNFPTAGSFVAEPFQEDAPMYNMEPQRSYPSTSVPVYVAPYGGRERSASPMMGRPPSPMPSEQRAYSSEPYGGNSPQGYRQGYSNGYERAGNSYSPSPGYANSYIRGVNGPSSHVGNSYAAPSGYASRSAYPSNGGVVSYGPPPTWSRVCGAPRYEGESRGYPSYAEVPSYGFPTAGSFVAEPFAVGAPSVSMARSGSYSPLPGGEHPYASPPPAIDYGGMPSRYGGVCSMQCMGSPMSPMGGGVQGYGGTSSPMYGGGLGAGLPGGGYDLRAALAAGGASSPFMPPSTASFIAPLDGGAPFGLPGGGLSAGPFGAGFGLGATGFGAGAKPPTSLDGDFAALAKKPGAAPAPGPKATSGTAYKRPPAKKGPKNGCC